MLFDDRRKRILLILDNVIWEVSCSIKVGKESNVNALATADRRVYAFDS